MTKRGPALHIDALTLMTRLHLLTLCRLAVQQAQRRCPPPLPAGPGGTPRRYMDEALLLIALLRTLWHLSPRAMADWLLTVKEALRRRVIGWTFSEGLSTTTSGTPRRGRDFRTQRGSNS